METSVGTEVAVDNGKDTSIEVGSRGATFDDFEAIEVARKDVKEAKKNDAKEGKKETVKHDGKEKTVEVGDKEPRKTEGKGKDSEKTKEPEKEAIKKEIKKLKARIGDGEEASELELPLNAKLPWKVGGQDVEVELLDVLNNYSGKVPWDKKYSEIDLIRKTVEGEKREYQERLDKINKLYRDEKSSPVEALSYMLDLAGVPKHDYLRKIRDALVPDVEQFAQLSPEEKRAYLAEQENRVLREIAESDNRKRVQEETRKSLSDSFAKIREAHQLDETDLTRAYNFGIEKGISVETPEDVAGIAIELRAVDRAKSLIESVDSQILSSASGREIWHNIAEIIYKDPSFSDDEIREVIAETFGVEADVKKVKEKAEVKAKETSYKKKTVEPDPFASFRDLDD